jgi:hypothetical protein
MISKRARGWLVLIAIGVYALSVLACAGIISQ